MYIYIYYIVHIYYLSLSIYIYIYHNYILHDKTRMTWPTSYQILVADPQVEVVQGLAGDILYMRILL